MQKPIIGQIGTGWVGESYATEFESRGFTVVRYDIAKYPEGKDKIKECGIVFIAVPTPTTPNGFDYSIVESVLPLVGENKIAVIKSTVLPGTTRKLQEKFPNITLLHSPEFLAEATAKQDVERPKRNIIGYVTSKNEIENRVRVAACHLLHSILPKAAFSIGTPVENAEIVKYAGNCFLFMKVVFANLVAELTEKVGGSYIVVKDCLAADPRIGESHLQIDHNGGKGAGGHCFVKDMKAFSDFYKQSFPLDSAGNNFLKNLQKKNINLLTESNKNVDILRGVFGENYMENFYE